MSHIFISYASRDGNDVAHALVAALEAGGQRCWVGYRDVRPGADYPSEIVRAIHESRGLALLLTPGANDSRDVLQEVQRAHGEGKPIVPLIVRETQPSDGLRYFLGVRQHIAWSDPRAVAAALGNVLGPALGNGDAAASARTAYEGEATPASLRVEAGPGRLRGVRGASRTTVSRALGCGVALAGMLAVAIGAFALLQRAHQVPAAARHDELLTSIRGTWAPQRHGCGHDMVRYDFAKDDKGATISQDGKLLGPAIITPAGAIVVRRAPRQWEFEPDGKRLHVTAEGVETTLIRCAP